MPNTKEKEIIEEKKVEIPKLSGKYLSAVGHRKTAIANVRLFKKGSGIILINNLKINDYFSQDKVTVAKQSLKLTGYLKDVNVSAFVKGGGKQAQSEAVRHGLSRVLIELDAELKPSLKAKGYLTRDARKKERKKPGLKRARRSPQWSKR